MGRKSEEKAAAKGTLTTVVIRSLSPFTWDELIPAEGLYFESIQQSSELSFDPIMMLTL